MTRYDTLTRFFDDCTYRTDRTTLRGSPIKIVLCTYSPNCTLACCHPIIRRWRSSLHTRAAWRLPPRCSGAAANIHTVPFPILPPAQHCVKLGQWSTPHTDSSPFYPPALSSLPSPFKPSASHQCGRRFTSLSPPCFSFPLPSRLPCYSPLPTVRSPPPPSPSFGVASVWRRDHVRHLWLRQLRGGAVASHHSGHPSQWWVRGS